MFVRCQADTVREKSAEVEQHVAFVPRRKHSNETDGQNSTDDVRTFRSKML